MSIAPVLAQIPQVTPEAPPFIPDLVGNLDTVWWVLLVAAVIAFVVGFASYRGVIRLPISSEFPMLFGGPIAAAAAIWALSYGT